jgi:hypothetical protein
MRISVIFRGALPIFVSVTTRGLLLVRTGWPSKFRVSTESFTTVPTPFRLTTCGLSVASSEMVMLPLLEPFAVGVNVTLMVQELLPVRLPAPVFVWEKSPLAVRLVTLSVAAPVFLSVMAWEALGVPSTWLPKLRALGERRAEAAAGVGRAGVVTAKSEHRQRKVILTSPRSRQRSAKLTFFVKAVCEPAPPLHM